MLSVPSPFVKPYAEPANDACAANQVYSEQGKDSSQADGISGHLEIQKSLKGNVTEDCSVDKRIIMREHGKV